MSTASRATALINRRGIATTISGTSVKAIWNRVTGSTAERYLNAEEWLRAVYEVTVPAGTTVRNGTVITRTQDSTSWEVRNVSHREGTEVLGITLVVVGVEAE